MSLSSYSLFLVARSRYQIWSRRIDLLVLSGPKRASKWRKAEEGKIQGRDVAGISMGTSKVEPELTDEVGKIVEGFQYTSDIPVIGILFQEPSKQMSRMNFGTFDQVPYQTASERITTLHHSLKSLLQLPVTSASGLPGRSVSQLLDPSVTI